MADLQKRPSRKVREQRAYRYGLATATFGFLAVFGGILAIVGIMGMGLPFLALVIAAVCGLLFWRTVSP